MIYSLSLFLQMNQGTISKLIHGKGFGFIAQEGKDEELFFHTTALENVSFEELKEGDAVTFEIGEGPKGPNATNVNKADANAAPAEESAEEEA